MKYKNINPLEKLHPGEPYFFVRAQDVHSVNLVNHYADKLEISGDRTGAVEVRRIADAMVAWQRANPGKVKHPD